MSNPAFHWAFMDEINPECHEAYAKFSSLTNSNQVLPPKYRELLVFGMACVLRSAPAVKTHGMNCIQKYGATKEELFAVMATAMSMAGVPAYREAALNLEDFLSEI